MRKSTEIVGIVYPEVVTAMSVQFPRSQGYDPAAAKAVTPPSTQEALRTHLQEQYPKMRMLDLKPGLLLLIPSGQEEALHTLISSWALSNGCDWARLPIEWI